MDIKAQEEEAKIFEKQAAQDEFAAEAAADAVAAEGGVNVQEFEDTESTIHGL